MVWGPYEPRHSSLLHNVAYQINVRLSCRVERCLDILDDVVDATMTYLGPVFVVLAVVLISMCMWAFYQAVFGEVCVLCDENSSIIILCKYVL
jgi:hypothetical protein